MPNDNEEESIYFDITSNEFEFQDNMMMHKSGISMRNIVCDVTNQVLTTMLNIPFHNIMEIIQHSNNSHRLFHLLNNDDELQNKVELMIDSLLTEIDIEAGEEILPVIYRDYDIDDK